MASEPPFASVKPGDLLLGKYRVERVLGAGGMGMVVAAMHVELGQRVAVKFLNPLVLHGSEAEARFTREARASARIKSDHVARVIDVGRLDNGAPYMVMEYLEGEDLAATLQRGPLPVEDAVDYLVQVCDAMAEAHLEGIVHRDLKPANLFLVARKDGAFSVKVLDFGISKLVMPDAEEASLTKTATVMGSPLYMSPEQMRSARDVDRRTDVWSLGVILFELLSGHPPFTGQTFPELVSAVLTDPAPSLRLLRPEVPLDLEIAILRCLEKAPERRFQDVGELAAAIASFGSRRSRASTERVVKVVSVTSVVDSGAKAPAKASGTLVSAGTPAPSGGGAGTSTTSPSTRSLPPAPRMRWLRARWLAGLGGAALLGLAWLAIKVTKVDAPVAAAPATPAARAESDADSAHVPLARVASSEPAAKPAPAPSDAKTASPEVPSAPHPGNAVGSRPPPARAPVSAATPAAAASESRRNLTLKIDLK